MTWLLLAAVAILLLDPATAHAVQQHSAPEGFYIHQIGHVIFLAAMVFMFRVLNSPTLSGMSGWRWVRRAALLFALWNVDAFISHAVEARLEPVEAYFLAGRLNLTDATSYAYIATRLLENFFLVPAFILLGIGIVSLKRQLEREEEV